MTEPKKRYPLRKECKGPCGKKRARSKFRILSSGYLQSMCRDCEREYERERWHRRNRHRPGKRQP